jgi:hypothetical protein
MPDAALTLRVNDDGTVRVPQWAGQLVTVRPVGQRRQRSLDQNAYWWAVPVAIIADYCGYEPEQMHYALLGEWRGYADGPVGPPVPRCASSSKLTTSEFTELIDWVQRWAAQELDVQIPSPGEWERTRDEE